MRLLDAKNITTEFKTEQGIVKAVRDVSFHLDEGEAIGVVGESGSGKSVTMLSIMGLLSENGYLSSGDINFNGQNISPHGMNKKQLQQYDKMMQKLRGNQMAMIFQDPMTYLNPVLKIGKQIIEPLQIHQKLSMKDAKKRAIELMEMVGIPSPEKRLNQYPHEFSGGMRQRIIIAIALSCNPKLIIADEPTTALDVTIQMQVLKLISSLKEKLGTSIIMITHDLGVVAEMCTRIIIMYGGKIVEQGPVEDIFYRPAHPYTKGLLGSITNPDADEKAPLVPILGSPPDLLKPPLGCPFVDRCKEAMRICKEIMPENAQIGNEHLCACWLSHKSDYLSEVL